MKCIHPSWNKTVVDESAQATVQAGLFQVCYVLCMMVDFGGYSLAIVSPSHNSQKAILGSPRVQKGGESNDTTQRLQM